MKEKSESGDSALREAIDAKVRIPSLMINGTTGRILYLLSHDEDPHDGLVDVAIPPVAVISPERAHSDSEVSYLFTSPQIPSQWERKIDEALKLKPRTVALDLARTRLVVAESVLGYAPLGEYKGLVVVGMAPETLHGHEDLLKGYAAIMSARASLVRPEKVIALGISKKEVIDGVDQIVKDNLDLFLLGLMLRNGEVNGYTLLKKIYEASRVLLSQGTLYPALYRLLDEGLIEKRDDSLAPSNTKLYHLTPAGRDAIVEKLGGLTYGTEYVLKAFFDVEGNRIEVSGGSAADTRFVEGQIKGLEEALSIAEGNHTDLSSLSRLLGGSDNGVRLDGHKVSVRYGALPPAMRQLLGQRLQPELDNLIGQSPATVLREKFGLEATAEEVAAIMRGSYSASNPSALARGLTSMLSLFGADVRMDGDSGLPYLTLGGINSDMRELFEDKIKEYLSAHPEATPANVESDLFVRLSPLEYNRLWRPARRAGTLHRGSSELSVVMKGSRISWRKIVPKLESLWGKEICCRPAALHALGLQVTDSNLGGLYYALKKTHWYRPAPNGHRCGSGA